MKIFSEKLGSCFEQEKSPVNKDGGLVDQEK